MDTKKPPIGLRPEWLHNEQRLAEVAAAITRYVDARAALPENWINEYNLLRTKVEEHNAKKAEPIALALKTVDQVIDDFICIFDLHNQTENGSRCDGGRFFIHMNDIPRVEAGKLVREYCDGVKSKNWIVNIVIPSIDSKNEFFEFAVYDPKNR